MHSTTSYYILQGLHQMCLEAVSPERQKPRKLLLNYVLKRKSLSAEMNY